MSNWKDNVVKNIRQKRVSVRLETLSLSLIICLSFIFHLFSGTIYSIVLATLTAIYVMSKPIVKGKLNSISSLWLISLCVIVVSYLRSYRSLGALMDVIVLSIGVLLILFCSRREETYERCIKIVTFFGVFFAVGVYVQRFLPSIYSIYLRILPGDLADIVGTPSSGSYIRGFATNAGFTAGYICAGTIAVMSSTNPLKRKRLRKIILIIFLVIALLYTGKRGHALFMFLTITVCYLFLDKGLDKVKIYWKAFLMFLISGKKLKKVKSYWKVFLVIIIIVILVFTFRDLLATIPLIDRMIDTINGLIAGKDVSSARLSLYSWAWKLFTENPLLGIGWGVYRTTVVGNATYAAVAHTHNIYLQLLSETGIIGFFFIVLTFLVFWVATKKAYYQCLSDDNTRITAWRRNLFFSFGYQTFFLLYGLTGNVLYDTHYQIIYLFACSIVVAYRVKFGYQSRLKS